MNRYTLLATAVAATLLASAPAHADTLFTSAAFADISNSVPTTPWCSSCGGAYKVFDTFSLSHDSVLTGVDFGIADWYGSNWNIEISILDSTRTNTLFSAVFPPINYTFSTPGNGIAQVSAALPNVALSAGSYWMSWYDANNMAVPGFTVPGGQLFQEGIGTHNDHTAAFQITGTVAAVPEPETYAMLLAGLGVLGFMGKRRKAG